jgi:RES domain-containing protein
MDLEQLAGRIDALGAAVFETTAYRHTAPGLDSRSGEGARIHGGRWNPPESFPCLYLGVDPETVADELHRLAARQSLRPEDLMPRELHRFELHLQAVADLRSAEAQHAVGLTIETIRAEDPTLCQHVGESAHYLGLEGIVAPSAAGPGVVVAVFIDRLRPGSVVESRGSELWAVPPPARGDSYDARQQRTGLAD